jgi:two-component sensor histidine kinase
MMCVTYLMARLVNMGPYLRLAAAFVSISLIAEENFIINWREPRGSVVTAPQRKGFGHMLFQSMKASEGEVEPSFAPEGFHWRFTAPAALVLSA